MQPSTKSPYDKVCTYAGLKTYDTKSPYDKYAGLPVHAKAFSSAEAYSYDEGFAHTCDQQLQIASAYKPEQQPLDISQLRKIYPNARLLFWA